MIVNLSLDEEMYLCRLTQFARLDGVYMVTYLSLVPEEGDLELMGIRGVEYSPNHT